MKGSHGLQYCEDEFSDVTADLDKREVIQRILAHSVVLDEQYLRD